MSKFVRPKVLGEGSVIGIAAASSPFSRARFGRGVEVLKELGFKVRFGKDIFRKRGYLAGSDEERARELNRLFADKSLSAIMFARGGYGIQRIMSLLDFDALKKSPKVIVGYSDLSVLTAYIISHLNLNCIHGPDVKALGNSRDATALSLKNILTSKEPLGEMKTQSLTLIKEGRAEGPMMGGCLTMVVSSIGTPYAPVVKDGILLLEDHIERVYKYDRMLTQLKNSGMLSRVKGIVFGSMGLDAGETNPGALWPMVADVLSDFKGPIVYGLRSGHLRPFYSVPLGVKCSLLAGVAGGRGQVRLVFKEAALNG